MKSELTDEFVKCFVQLPERVQKTARKNYKLWKKNPAHPSLEFRLRLGGFWQSRRPGVDNFTEMGYNFNLNDRTWQAMKSEFEEDMPAISMFYGIIVYMYFMDNKQHNIPHIHVKYQKHEVIVAIPDGEVLEGAIPKAKMKLLQAWIELHKDELVADWELAVSGQQPYKIEPLR